MGTRRKPRKNPTIMKDNDASSIEPNDVAHVPDAKTPQSISDFPTRKRKSPQPPPSDELPSVEPSTMRESPLVIPNEWRNMPFDEMREEGWKPRRTKKQDGREYMSVRLSWTGEEGKTQSKDRAFGRYDPDRYAILVELMNPEHDGGEDIFSTDDSGESPESEQDGYGTMEVSEIAPDRLPNAQRYAVRGAKILQSGVGKNISIPDKFYYGTDMLEFYEYFKSKGFSGTIVDWIHECVRNYVAEHCFKVGIIFERRGSS